MADQANDEELARRLQQRYLEGSRRKLDPTERFRQTEIKEQLDSSEFEFIDFDELGRGFSEKLDAIGDGNVNGLLSLIC